MGFEPTMLLNIHHFKRCALDHSAIHSKNNLKKENITKIGRAGFEPTIQNLYIVLAKQRLKPTQPPSPTINYLNFYVNKIKNAIINANNAIASVNAKPKSA